MKLALIPYLNCEPFYEGITELGHEIVWEPPRLLGERAARGEQTCGPMAVADLFRLSDRFEPLGNFGIACEGSAHSVLLFARREIGELSGCPVGLTTESSTSVRLLELLLGGAFGVADAELRRGEQADDEARLLIGDRALVAAATGLDGFPFVYDLGAEWHGWQALPFVFARWAIKKDTPAAAREWIETALIASLESWPERVGEITARRGGALGLDEKLVHDYLATFTYRLGPVEEMGEKTFRKLLEARS
jgi:chorismate dehydratase